MEINKLYCMDNIEGMSQLPDNFIDLTVTSPPYDKLRKYNGYSFSFESVVKQLYRATKDGGIVVWVIADQTVNGTETGTSFKQALGFMEFGFNLHDTMIYAKSNPMPKNDNRYEPAFEYMFVFSKGKVKTFNPILEKSKMFGKINKGTQYDRDGNLKNKWGYGKPYKEYKVKSNIWYYPVGRNKIKGHPAVFPEQLAQDHILSWSNKGDLVFDPFVGSGTTPKMAKLLGRNYLGFDISQEYIDIANKRLGFNE